ALEKFLLSFDRLHVIAQMRDTGVGGGKEMAVNEARGLVGGIEKVRAEIRGFLERHVAGSAVLFGLVRIIKAARTVAGNTAEQIAVVMILAAQKIFIVIQIPRDADFMAGRAKLRRAHERF